MKLTMLAKLRFPDPLALAMILSLITMLLAWLFGPNTSKTWHGMVDVFAFWEKGFWDLLAFSMQMVLILFLGYMLALTPILDGLSNRLTKLASQPVALITMVAFSALILGFVNWGLALVFGAVFVRKIGDAACREGRSIPYALLGATAYVCMMVWHGGLSGSAPLSVAEESHFLSGQSGTISLSDTIFSKMNLWAWAVLVPGILILALIMLKKAKFIIPSSDVNSSFATVKPEKTTRTPYGLLFYFGLLMFAASLINKIFVSSSSAIGLNDINFILLSFVFIFAGDVRTLQAIATRAIGSTLGIVIQFPLYAGIMGIVKYSGLLVVFTQWFSGVADAQTFPVLTMLSAGLVNLFVPSGGGQWAVQGPLIIETARLVDIPFSKAVMALAYGDQLTNMLQPFWALPLLGITGLKAGQLFRYTIIYFLFGLLVFGMVLSVI